MRIYVGLYTVGKSRCILLQDKWMSVSALAFEEEEEEALISISKQQLLYHHMPMLQKQTICT